MCGISGVIGVSIPEERMARAMDAMRHRGPNQSGQWSGGTVRLGHVRLSIIDLSADGRQPMTNEDGTIVLVYNGEIYNFQELRRQLEAGHTFHSRTDSEVLIHGYEQWGIDGLLRRIRGMFALGIWDSGRQVLHLARDHLGKKPLFYRMGGTTIRFASTLPALLELLDTTPPVCPNAVLDYLAYLSIPAPETIFEGVWKLPPAHRLEFHASGRTAIERYWKPDFTRKENRDDREWIDAIDRQLNEAVQDRMVADVPVGAFLSGGVDSSVVVGMMSRLSSRQIVTLSMGFHEQSFNEIEHARAVAAYHRTDHHELILAPHTSEMLPEIAFHHGEPFGDHSALPTFHLAKFARQHVSVVLTGDGGDESFAGYANFQALALAERLRRMPGLESGRVRGLFRRVEQAGVPGARKLNWIAQYLGCAVNGYPFDPVERRAFGRPEEPIFGPLLARARQTHRPESHYQSCWEEAGVSSWIDRALYVDLVRQLPNTFLTKVDVATMAYSVEARSPLLDLRLVELACRIPPDRKLPFLRSKHLLKKVAERYVPRGVIYRRKQGFSVPVAAWMRSGLGRITERLLLSPQAGRRGHLRAEGVRALLEAHRSGRADHGNRLWLLLMLELWFRLFVDRDLSPSDDLNSL